MIEKQKRHVNIVCHDGISINAFICVLGETRTFDVMNHSAEMFLLLADVEIIHQEDLQHFKLAAKTVEKKESLILNKSAIKWIEELKD